MTMPLPPDPAPLTRRSRARHCPELLGTGPSLAELSPALAQLGDKLARALGIALARANGGDVPAMRAGLPTQTDIEALIAADQSLASHALMAIGAQRLPLLASFAAETVLRLVDRTFGGLGAIPTPFPQTFPLSAQLLIERIENALAVALGDALGVALGGNDTRVQPLRRATSLRELRPFAASEALLQVEIEVSEAGAEPWGMTLAMPQPTLTAILSVPRRAPPTPARSMSLGPTDAPFADIELGLTALLVDMNIAFSRLANLMPGDVLPVAVARAVPIQVDGRTIATGTVGEVEDRVAIQIAQSF